jgi:hypothetical protein
MKLQRPQRLLQGGLEAGGVCHKVIVHGMGARNDESVHSREPVKEGSD